MTTSLGITRNDSLLAKKGFLSLSENDFLFFRLNCNGLPSYMAIEKSGKWGLKPLDSSTPDGINLQLYISGHMCCVVGSLHGAAVIPKEHVFAYGPKTGPAFLRFFALWLWGGVGWGGVVTSCVYVIIDFLGWPRFMLCCTFLLYIGEHTSCYIAHFRCTSVNTLHVTLHTSVALRWPNFMLRCTLLLYFCDQTSCYIAHFCCTSVNTLHVTLHTSVVLQWTHQQEWGWEVGKMGSEPMKLETWNFTDIKGQECLGASGWSDVYMDFKWRCLWRNLSSPASSQNWLFRCETDFWEWTTSGLICAQHGVERQACVYCLLIELVNFLNSSDGHVPALGRSSGFADGTGLLKCDPVLCPRTLLWLQIGHKLNKMLAKCRLEPWPSAYPISCLGATGGAPVVAANEIDSIENWWSKWQMWRMQFGPFVVYFHDKDLL